MQAEEALGMEMETVRNWIFEWDDGKRWDGE
jgi:hypothetical protein